MTKQQPNEKITSYALLGMTAVTGIIDGVSFLALGRVFTANMTGRATWYFSRSPQREYWGSLLNARSRL